MKGRVTFSSELFPWGRAPVPGTYPLDVAGDAEEPSVSLQDGSVVAVSQSDEKPLTAGQQGVFIADQSNCRVHK